MKRLIVATAIAGFLLTGCVSNSPKETVACDVKKYNSFNDFLQANPGHVINKDARSITKHSLLPFGNITKAETAVYEQACQQSTKYQHNNLVITKRVHDTHLRKGPGLMPSGSYAIAYGVAFSPTPITDTHIENAIRTPYGSPSALIQFIDNDEKTYILTTHLKNEKFSHLSEKIISNINNSKSPDRLYSYLFKLLEVYQPSGINEKLESWVNYHPVDRTKAEAFDSLLANQPTDLNEKLVAWVKNHPTENIKFKSYKTLIDLGQKDTVAKLLNNEKNAELAKRVRPLML